MPTLRIRVRETNVTQGCADFDVVADTPEAAAAILQSAYQEARSNKREAVTLPDGQTKLIEAEPILPVVVSYYLLDDTDGEVRTIKLPANGLDA